MITITLMDIDEINKLCTNVYENMNNNYRNNLNKWCLKKVDPIFQKILDRPLSNKPFLDIIFFKKQGDNYQIISSNPAGSINYIFKKYHQYSFGENNDIDILYHKTGETSKILQDYFRHEFPQENIDNNYQITDFINFSIEAMQLLCKTSDHLEVDNNSFIIDFSSETKEINDFLIGYRKLLYCNKINPEGIVVFPVDNLFFKLHELSSTGEENLIQFLGQLIELISNAESGNHIILIDEIDESFHPSWSNKMVQLLSLCCTYFLDIENSSCQNPTFQFIITTHSPFILSDIKNHNVISLKENYGKVISKQVNTFAKNIQRIIYDEMDTSDIYGTFAQSKINKIVNILNQASISSELIEKTKSEVQTINEPIIRNKLNQMLLDRISPNEKVKLLISDLTDEELDLLKKRLKE